MDSVNGESSNTAKQRGAAEEIISKRLKTLTKKIVRIKGYNTSTLNADQQAAIASLPPLEAVARELEELIKPGGPIETTELAQAGQIRELKEEMLVKQEKEIEARVEEYKQEISGRLSRFLRLRESTGLTAEDVSRMDSVYENLKSRGLDQLLEFELPTTIPSREVADNDSQSSWEAPSQRPTPGTYNFLQRDEVDWLTPKSVDWSEEVEDEGLIFEGDGKLVFGEGVQEPQQDNGEEVKEEEIPVLEPELPIHNNSEPAHTESLPSTEPNPSAEPNPSTETPNPTEPNPPTKRKNRRQPKKPKNTEAPSTEKKINGTKVRDPANAGLPPKPVDDGFEQVVRKQATRGRGRGTGSRGRGRGRGGGAGGAVEEK